MSTGLFINKNAGPVSKHLREQDLETLQDVAHKIQNDRPISNVEALAIKMAAPLVIEELILRRRAMEVIEDIANIETTPMLARSA